jgi:pyruvate/2-oxoglutarate dehydrogenase complex dihydrolipoamide dehydrogenase (E3) component
VERFQAKGGRFLRGQARIVGPREVEVDGQRLRARRGIVLASGGEPATPPIDGLAGVDFWTNREAIEAAELPRSLVVLGAGPVGLELAQAFHRLGTAITLVEVGEHALPMEEPEQGAAMDEVVRAEGMTLHAGVSAVAVKPRNGGVGVWLSDGKLVEAERLLVATGRWLDLGGLGVEAAGLDPTPQPSRSTRICAPVTASGRSATSLARVPSPTWRSTRVGSRPPTSSAWRTSRPTTRPCPG